MNIPQIVAARNVKLHDLKTNFGLQRVEEEQFFREWLDNLPDLTAEERQVLDRVKCNYLYLLEYPVKKTIDEFAEPKCRRQFSIQNLKSKIQNSIKMVVLSPLLDLAGFYKPPFRVAGETHIRVSAEDEGEVIQGSIDVLVIQEQLWVTVIEAKNSEFSLTKALPQALAYMLACPQFDRPLFGLVLNGSEFLFIKLKRNNLPEYGLSDLFSLLNRGNNLYQILQILKRLQTLMAIAPSPSLVN